MNKYKTLHKWMIIPMLIMQAGIFYDYWGDFSDNAWSVHIHYLTGTVWYLYLIIQPYYATHGQMAKHRTNGIIGMFIAGAVCITALSMLHRDFVSAEGAIADPDRFGPFKPWFFLGVAAVEIVMMIAFGYAVIKSIIHRKQVEDHAWWLISTVFIIMMPALGRGAQFVTMAMYGDNWPDIDIMSSLYISTGLIIAMLLFFCMEIWKAQTSCYLAGFSRECIQSFFRTYRKIGTGAIVFKSADQRINNPGNSCKRIIFTGAEKQILLTFIK